MEKPFGIFELLGEENVEKIKNSIVKIITDKFRDDMDEYSAYLIYPPDFNGLVEDTVEDTYKKLRKMYKEAVLDIHKEYIEKLKIYMLNSFDSDKLLRKEIYDLAKQYYCMSNEYGKERKFANELIDILKITQDQFEKEIDIHKRGFDE